MRRNTQGVIVGEAIAPPPTERPWEQPDMVEPLIAMLEPHVTEARRARLLSVFERRIDAVTLVADALHDPHNGAALIRSADAFGLTTFHAIERNEKLAVAGSVARGSHKWVEVARHQSGQAAVDSLRASGHVLVATHPEGRLLPEDLASIPKLALVLGNEHAGIDAALAEACEQAVRVPMVGFVESLNVSVTAAILLYAATRGRRGDLSEGSVRRAYARGLWLTVPRPDQHLAAYRARLR